MGIEPNYFLDEISNIEVNAILDAYADNYKESWEQTRWLGFFTVNSMVGGLKKPEDLMKFDWDKVEKQKVYTQEEKVKLQYKLININKNKNGKI